MQQSLSLLYRNHRNSLAYPENVIHLRYRPSYEQVFSKPRRGFMMANEIKLPSKSVEPQPKTDAKPVEAVKPRTKPPLTQKLSKEEEKLMKKYFQSFIPEQKLTIQLPSINSNRVSRGETTRGFHSNAATSFYKQSPQPISPQKRQKNMEKLKKKFKRCVRAIIFIHRLKACREVSLDRIEQLSVLSQNVKQIISKTINKYYSQVLIEPFEEFGEILRKQILDPSYKPTKEIANNLLSMSQCLKTSSVRRDVLRFLTLQTLENSPLADNFFSEYELLRLQIKSNCFRLKKVHEQQVRMVVGMFLGVKLFCNNIFYEPWNIECLNLPTKLNKRVKLVINHYSSFFYTSITNIFNNLPIHGSKYINKLEKRGIYAAQIVEESSQFHDRLFLDFEPILRKAQSNINQWVYRVGSEVIKNRLRELSSQPQ